MSSADLSSGQGASTSAELRRQAQESVRVSVASANTHGRSDRRWTVPLAVTAVVAAAACAPVVWPLLLAAGVGSGGAAAVGAALTQVGGVGGGLLTEAVIRAWDRVRSRGQSEAGQADLCDALAAELEAGLTLDTPAAAALRREVAGVLRAVDAVQVALTATVKESAADVREALVRGLGELGEEFTEFGWVLDEVKEKLTGIYEDVAQMKASGLEATDTYQQVLVEISVLRDEVRRGFGRPEPPAVPAGPSADEEHAAVLDAAGVPVSDHCPYLGLAAFQPKDAKRFFGRERLTAELVTRAGDQLARPGLLMVLGPSGSGKSSLLRAGLLPAVVAGALPARGSTAWPRFLMTPGPCPLQELAARIASLAAIPAGALEADLRTDPARITGAIRQALLTHGRRRANAPSLTPSANLALEDLDGTDEQAEEPDTGLLTAGRQASARPRLVLIVDQFEEVFSPSTGEQERRTFIKALCAAAGAGTSDSSPIRGRVNMRQAPALVVIGLRADFYARSAAYPELAPQLQNHQVLVGPIDEAGLREAIEKPATTAGLVADEALVEVLLADLGLRTHPDATPAITVADSSDRAATTGEDSYAAGRLALLSYALQQTWRNKEGRRLTVAGYRATGGIDGAVAQAADNVYDRLDAVGKDTLRRVLLRLVTLGEGTPDTRRRVAMAELTASEDSTRADATAAVVADLIDARLVTADEDTVEITHETLLTAWPRLRQWLSDDRAGLRILRDLTAAAHDWQREGHDPGRLFRGTRLTVAQDWATRHSQDLNAGERAFLNASLRDRLRATRRRRTAVAALAALTVLSAITAVVAIKLRGDALTARDQAIANQVAAEADQLTATNPSLAAQLDLVANQMNPTPSIETRLMAASTTPLSSSLTGPANSVLSVAFSLHTRILAAGGADKKVWLWNLANPARPTRLGRPLAGPGGDIYSVAFSPDGQILAAGGADKKVWLWNLANPARPTPIGHLTGPTEEVSSVAFSPSGQILAVGSDSGKVWLWNFTDPASPAPLGKPLTVPKGFAGSVAFSPDQPILAVGSGDHKVWLWNLTHSAHPIPLGKPLTGPDSPVYSVAFSPDGQILAAGGNNGSVTLWSFADPAHPTAIGKPLTGPASTVYSVAFSRDGQVLAAGSDDNKVWLWNLADPAYPTPLGQPLTGPTGSVEAVAFSPNGPILAAGTESDTVLLWHLPSSVLTAGPVLSVAVSPDGRILAAGSGDRTVRLWNLANPARPVPLGKPLTGPTNDVNSVAFSRDGKTLAVGSSDNKVWLWNLINPAQPTPVGKPLTGPAKAVYALAFSPDGQILVAGSADKKVWMWSRTARAPLGWLNGPTEGVDSVAFRRQGSILAVGSADSRIWLWNLAHPAHPHSLGQPLNATTLIGQVAFSPNGRILAAGTQGDHVLLWNVANPAHPTKLGQPLTGPTGYIATVAFSRDGRILAAGGADDKVWLWSLADPAHPTSLGQPLTGPTNTVNAVTFSPNTHTLVAGSGDGTIRLWNLDINDAVQRICATTSNTLTRPQWNRYISQLPYNPPCTHPGHYGLLAP
jgi:WD40 repeat protein